MIAVLLLIGLTGIPTSAAAEPPDCRIRYTLNDVLELRDSKPFDIRLDCGWLAENFDVAVTEPPHHGTLGAVTWDGDLHEHVMQYDPADSYVGPDQFTLSVTDGVESAQVSVQLELVSNTAPACDLAEFERSETVAVGEPAIWIETCRDPDLQDMYLEKWVPTEPGHGDVVVEPVLDMTSDTTVTIRYTPEPGFVGTDRFTAGVTDSDTAATFDFDVVVDDGTAPVLTLGVARQKPRQVARRGLDVSATSDEMVTGTIRVTVPGRTAKRLGLVRRADGPVQIGSVREELEGGVPAEIRLGLRSRPAKAIRNAKRVLITVRLRGVDPLGNATVVTRRATLRR